MQLLQSIKKLYGGSILRKTPWIASSCFSTPLQNHPHKDAKRLTEKLRFSIFACHQAKQSRKSIWNTLKPVLFVLVFVVIGIGSFGNPTFVHAVPDDGNSNVGCPSGTVRTAKTKECVPNFIPLVGIPYIDNPEKIGSMAEYVSALYKISISIAAFLAVIKIIFAGVKYMLSDVVTTKDDAKKDIRGALIGLLIVIGAVLILNTINPQLRNLNVLKGPGVQVGLKKHETFNIKIGDEELASSIDANKFSKSCDNNGGSTSMITRGTGSDARHYLKCGETQTLISKKAYETLLDTNGISVSQKQTMMDLYEQYIHPNITISKAEITAAAIDTSSELFSYINNKITKEEFDILLAQYSGLNPQDAQQEVIFELFNNNMVYVQAGDIQNSADRIATTETLCEAATGHSAIIVSTQSSPVIVCMK